jgi:hypothetical protein
MKGDSPLDKCKDTIFKCLLQKWIDSTINEYADLLKQAILLHVAVVMMRWPQASPKTCITR